MIENPKKTRRNSHLAIFASLMLSITSAYCTVSGIHSLFIGGGLMVSLIASCIESSRVSTVFLIHHYWNKLTWGIKTVGCSFILIACLFSAWGVYGYLSSAYGTQLDNIAPLTLQIQAKQDEIQIQQDIIDGNNQQIEGIKSSSSTQNKLFEKQLSGDTSNLSQEELTKIQKQQNRAIGNSEYYQTQINRLYNKNRTASDNIVKLKKEIAQLKADSIKVAPELQRMKGLASLFGINDDNVLITLVILLIMCIFDPLSMYLMVLGDNIGKMADGIEVDAIEKNDDIKKSLLEKIILKKTFKKWKKGLKEEKVEEPKSEIQVLSKDASKKIAERLLEESKPNDALKEAIKYYEGNIQEELKLNDIKKTKTKKSPKRSVKKVEGDIKGEKLKKRKNNKKDNKPNSKENTKNEVVDKKTRSIISKEKKVEDKKEDSENGNKKISIKNNSVTPLNKFNKFIELVKKDKSILNDKKIKDILDTNPSLKLEIEQSVGVNEKDKKVKDTRSWLAS